MVGSRRRNPAVGSPATMTGQPVRTGSSSDKFGRSGSAGVATRNLHQRMFRDSADSISKNQRRSAEHWTTLLPPAATLSARA
jgi:hypothetical protein